MLYLDLIHTYVSVKHEKYYTEFLNVKRTLITLIVKVELLWGLHGRNFVLVQYDWEMDFAKKKGLKLKLIGSKITKDFL